MAGDTIQIEAEINGTAVRNFADLAIAENTGGDAVVDLSDDNSVTIQDFGPGELSASDFLFV